MLYIIILTTKKNVLSSNNINTIRIEALGADFSAYINNHLVSSQTFSNQYTEGRIGLYLNNLEPSSIHFALFVFHSI